MYSGSAPSSNIAGTVNGGATNARAWSAYLDFMLRNVVSNFTETNLAEWTVGEPISQYPDFVASCIVIVLMLVTISGKWPLSTN